MPDMRLTENNSVISHPACLGFVDVGRVLSGLFS